MKLPKIPDSLVKGICKVGGVLVGIGTAANILLGGRREQIALEEAVSEEVKKQTQKTESED